MGNCQAIDNASLVIQQPSGRVDKLYSPVPATDIMKMNPGHYVALILTTTLYPSSSAAAAAASAATNNEPLRITRIKLLRPTDTLVLGHTYRLVSAQEVMKGLWAKKYAKMQKKQSESSVREEKTSSDLHRAAAATSYELEKKPKQVIKHDRHRPRASSSTNSASSSTAKSRGWHPSLQSISEARS